MLDLSKVLADTTSVQKVVDPFVDLGNMLLLDRDPIEGEVSDNLTERARNNAQYLINKIWELEKKNVDGSIVAVLPPPSFKLPREKRLPEKKEKTKWEKYAESKGIKKRKKEKKVFDEATKEWKPTYGFNRGNDNTKDILIEIPEGADPNKDYFAERKEKKKERVAKNELQRMKNLAKQLNTKVVKGPSVDSSIGLGVNPNEKSKEQLRFAVDRAKVATASAGKFQESIKGEKKNIKTGKKRQFDANEGSTNEKQRAMDILNKMKAKKAKIIEEKVSSVAGPHEEEKKERKGKPKKIRQKSQIHRQQWFKNKLSQKKKTRGNVRK